MSRDCTMRNDPEVLRQLNNGNEVADREYENLMLELGQGRNDTGRVEGASTAPWANYSNLGTAPPWAKALPDAHGSTVPPPWIQHTASIPPPPGVSQGSHAGSYGVPGTAPPSLSLYGPPPGMSSYGPPGSMYNSAPPSGLVTSSLPPPPPSGTNLQPLPPPSGSYSVPPPLPGDYNLPRHM